MGLDYSSSGLDHHIDQDDNHGILSTMATSVFVNFVWTLYNHQIDSVVNHCIVNVDKVLKFTARLIRVMSDSLFATLVTFFCLSSKQTLLSFLIDKFFIIIIAWRSAGVRSTAQDIGTE